MPDLASSIDVLWRIVMPTTLMLGATGLVIALLLRRMSIRSWRLRSWLIAAVLLQGVMFVRTPVHLGWIETNVSTPVANERDSLSPAAFGSPLLSPAEAASLRPATNRTTFTPLSDKPQVSTSWVPSSWSSVLGWVWAGFSIGIVLVGMKRYLRLARLLNDLDPAPRSWRRHWMAVSRRSSRRRAASKTRLLASESVGPLLVRRKGGYALILPRSYWQGLSQAQRTGVLLHELSHLERRDVWRQLLARSVAAVHWFNPIAWWAVSEYEQASEIACDERIQRHGRVAAAGFASALVEFADWRQRSDIQNNLTRGIGFQAMAAPPLSNRVARLLHSSVPGDSLMKRLILFCCAGIMIVVSFVQIRFTEAQDADEDGENVELRVIDEELSMQLMELVANLDKSDPTTARLAKLAGEMEGKIAMSGMLNDLAERAREDARADAVPRFIDAHFDTSPTEGLIIRPEHKETLARWQTQSTRLDGNIVKMKKSLDSIASRVDTSDESGALINRLLRDPQAAAAILLFEMEGGGDVITRFISEAMERILVERRDGKLQIVQSRRDEAEQQIQRFEMAGQIAKRLRRQLPAWAVDIDTSDERHKKFAAYMKKPLMATVVALHASEDRDGGSPAAIANRLFEQLESVCEETPNGMRIAEDEAWQTIEEFYVHADRAEQILSVVQERLSEFAARVGSQDELSERFAAQLKGEALAVMVSAELPYAEANPGEELEAMLSEVMSETDDGRLRVNEDRQEQVQEKVTELLRVCRAIRRHVLSVDEMLDSMEDKKFVESVGDSGRYWMLSEIRGYAEGHRPNPIDLAAKEMLISTESGQFRVREDRRQVVRELVEQAEQVRQEAANDDF